MVDSHNACVQGDCLDQRWFVDLAEARQTIDARQRDDNGLRPHGALGYRTPEAFRREHDRKHD